MTAAMALRTSSIPSSSTTPAAPADWRGRVELALTVAAARLTAGDLAGLAAVFADVSGWEDRQRAYQARCRLAELVLAYRPTDADAWVGAFVTGAACLLDALEQEPREPVLLNHAGVLLYELCEAGAAADIFRAALRLDPEHPHTQPRTWSRPACAPARNARLPGVHATRTRGLAARAKQGRGAGPAGEEPDALAVHDREGRGGDAPGLPRAAARGRRRDDRRRHRLDRPHGRDRRVVRRPGRALPLERLVLRCPQRLDRGGDRRLGDLPRRRRAHGGRPTPAACAACSAAPGARASTSSRPTTPAAPRPARPSRTWRCGSGASGRSTGSRAASTSRRRTRCRPTCPSASRRRGSGCATTAT